MCGFNSFAALSFSSLIFASAAQAVTVKNLDETDYKITIVEGASSQDLSLKPGASVNGICLKGCLIKLDAGQESYELEGGEVTSIEDGLLWGDDLDPLPTTSPEVPPGGASPGQKP